MEQRRKTNEQKSSDHQFTGRPWVYGLTRWDIALTTGKAKGKKKRNNSSHHVFHGDEVTVNEKM